MSDWTPWTPRIIKAFDIAWQGKWEGSTRSWWLIYLITDFGIDTPIKDRVEYIANVRFNG